MDQSVRAPGRPPGAAHAAVLLIGSCLPIVGLLLISPVLPQMQRHFAGTPGVQMLAPLTLTIPALALAIVGPFVGRLVDRTGRVRLLSVGMVLYTLFGTAPLYLDSLPAILGSRALLGIAEAVIMTTCLTLLGDYFTGHRRDRYLAMHAGAASLSAVVFLAVGGALGEIGWRAPFVIYVLPLLLFAVMVAILREPARQHKDPAAAPLEPLPWRRLAPLLILTVLSAVVFYGMQVQLSYVLDAIGTAAGLIGLAAALGNLGVLVSALIFPRILAGGAGRLLVIGLILASVGLIPMGLGGSWAVITVGAVIAGLGGGLVLPSLIIGTTARLSFQQRGRGTAAWTSTFYAGQFVAPFVAIAAGEATGGRGHGLVVVAVLGVALAVAAALVTRRRPLQTSAEAVADIPAPAATLNRDGVA